MPADQVVKLTVETKERIMSLKRYPRETIDDVIRRLAVDAERREGGTKAAS